MLVIWVARRRNALDGGAGVFDHRRHVVGIGVNDGIGVACDRHMALPEDQIAALQGLRFRPTRFDPEPASCMSLSRGQPVPQAFSAICTRPEQSMPRLVLPPHR